MNGLTLSLTRRSTGNTVEVYRHGRRITIHPVGPHGTLAPRSARGTGITAEEVQWILRRAIELAAEEGEPRSTEAAS